MFYYGHEYKLPTKGMVTVAVIDHSDTGENCVYVALPEFNNFRGIFYKSELPVRVKYHKKATKEMNQAEYIVCIATNDTKFRRDGHPNLIELSIKGIEQKYHGKIIDRFKNIDRILKMVKFISSQTKTSYDDISKNLMNDLIKPIYLNEFDPSNIDDFTEMYNAYLRNPKSLLDIMDLESAEVIELLDIFKTRIRENSASSTLDIDIAIWSIDKKGQDPVYVIRDLFKYVINKTKELKECTAVGIQYIGAPKYRICVSEVGLDSIDSVYKKIESIMVDYLKNNEIKGHDLKIDINSKVIHRGSISITYPFEINMYKANEE
jgi:translation initiation factor 2 alpha subunit (eIF-2alpha)